MNNIVMRQVTKTTNYALFVMHEQNRAVIGPTGVKPRKDLVESMKKDGFLETGHIVCTVRDDGKLLIIEGHNRFVVAKSLGLPVWFSAHPACKKATPMQHSQTIKAWGTGDFAAGHAQGISDYAEVMAFHKQTCIPVMACFALYAGMIASSSGNVNSSMKQGAFKIKNRELPFTVARITEAFGKFCDFSSSINFVTAISRAVFAEGFSATRMIERINRKPELIKRCNKVADYEALLETIYNHGVKSDRLYLQTEIEKAMRERNAAKKFGAYDV